MIAAFWATIDHQEASPMAQKMSVLGGCVRTDTSMVRLVCRTTESGVTLLQSGPSMGHTGPGGWLVAACGRGLDCAGTGAGERLAPHRTGDRSAQPWCRV